MAREGRDLSKSSRATIDREEIIRWTESRGGCPATVKGTGGQEDVGLIRIDFPGYSGIDSLTAISWDEFFDKFDEKNLALIIQEQTADGQQSRFNKLVSRDTVELESKASQSRKGGAKVSGKSALKAEKTASRAGKNAPSVSGKQGASRSSSSKSSTEKGTRSK